MRRGFRRRTLEREAAVNGRADGIATFNLRDFMGPARQFGIEVMRPGEAMKRLE